MNDVLQEMFTINANLLYSIVLATILGFIIGFERELTNKWAGLRTHILVCVGSCAFTLLSIHVFPTMAAGGNPQAFGDPARISAQILTGIGFIGGGTVLRYRGSIYGLTTAATLWITASIGMACGCGRFDIATYTAILAVSVLVLVRIFEKQFLHQNPNIQKKIKILISLPENEASNMLSKLREMFKDVSEITSMTCKNESACKAITMVIYSHESNIVSSTYDKLSELPKTYSVSVQEVYD